MLLNVLISAANRLIGEVVQSRRGPLLGSHLIQYDLTVSRVKLGPQRNYHKGWAAIRHYANQPVLLRDCENRLWNRWSTTQH